jgi:hypothetical protein
MRCVARFAPPPTVTSYAALRDHGQHQPGNTPCQIRRFRTPATRLSALWSRATGVNAVKAASRERGGGVSGAYKASARVLPQSHPCFDSRHHHTIVVLVEPLRHGAEAVAMRDQIRVCQRRGRARNASSPRRHCEDGTSSLNYVQAQIGVSRNRSPSETRATLRSNVSPRYLPLANGEENRNLRHRLEEI